ncbi:MAG: hypothetical protein LAO79_11590 [Acidobacteriia bacterium]|nr:hypothetical protein [Terriglobia bacterium]
MYAAGNTGGSFPTSARAAITNSVTSKTWAAKVTADGRAFLYATYLPAIFGSVNSIAVDAYGNAHIGGVTTDNRAAIVKLSADGSLILYLKVFGGPGSGSAPRLAIDGAGNLIVASTTSSPDFPVTTGVVQSHLAGFANVALTKLDPAGNIVFSTFFGGSGSDGVSSLQIDSAGSLYISGETTSLDFPTTPGTFAPQALVPTWGDFPGGFLAKLAPDATRIEFSTYLFSSSYGGSQIALGTAGDIFLAGVSGPGLPVRTSAPLPCLSQSVSQVGANFLARFDQAGRMTDATFLNSTPAVTAVAANEDGSISVLAGAPLFFSWSPAPILDNVRFGGPGWNAPACMTGAIFNSASMIRSDLVAPGELVSLLGSGIGPVQAAIADLAKGAPTNLASVRVLFDGLPAPILYAQSTQVNTQIPFALAARHSINLITGEPLTNVTLEYAGKTFGPFSVALNPFDPALYRLQPNVSTQAAALNQDGTINGPTNPAPRGSVNSLWGTGFGPLRSNCTEGALNPSVPIELVPEATVTALGLILYAGSAPGLACGVEQINMQVPADANPGVFSVAPTITLTEAGVTILSGQTSNVAVIYIK